MKKFIFIFLLSFSSFLSYSQLFEDFESAPPTPDASGVWTMTSGNWLVKDNRTNTGINWQSNVSPFPANSGTKAAFVNRENTGAGVYAEEWLITPQRTILANSQLRFFTRQTLTGDQGTTYQIRVSSAADPSDLTQYTDVLALPYSESDLSTLTADQLDYEEKIIDLSFTGPRYIAFVKIFTQPTGATAGDRWLVDDVKIVEKCLDPVAPLGTPVIGATTTRLEWTSTNTTFQVQYGPAGFTLDVPAPNVVISPVFTNNNAPRRRYEATGLLANTCYQFYVRSVCTDSNSNWVGPFNWCTLPLGRTCAEPIVATNPLPYSDSSNTTIYGNNIVNGSPGGAALCGAGAGFLGGNDVVYTYTPTESGNIFISMNPNGATNTGVFVYASCATVGTTCLAGVGNATSNIRVIPSLAVTAGVPIYIVISSTTATPTFPYTLTIQQATCPPTLPSTATVLGPTSANATWANGTGSTATAWEVAVQTAGSDVPSVAGTPTTVNTNYLMNTTLDGTPLTAGTSYQYWVRAACGDGLFSPWSGPYLFTTTLCEIANQCSYEFILSDLAGGWEGGRMEVRQNGVVVQTIGASLTGVGPLSVFVPLCTNIPFELFWSVAGNFPDEIRVAVKNNFGQTLYALTTNGQTSIGTTLYTGMVDCLNPMCLRPTGNPTVPAATITFNSAVVTWNVAGTSTTTTTGWGIYVVPQGSAAPTATTAPMYTTTGAGPTVSFDITGPPANLLPDTNYTVYVQALCSVNGPSTWTAGTNFRTKEQCPKPTALQAGTITPFGATLSWTNPTGAIWQVIVQLASEPAPAADDIRWDDLVATNGMVVTGLLPETAYEYYVRTDCGGGIISTPAGPKPFTTTVACPKPTLLTAVSVDAYTYTLGWTNPTGSSWQVLVQFASEPAPTALTPGWVTTTSNTFTANNLLPETAYEFYVRTDCGIVSGLSTWAGPKAFTTVAACFKPTALSSTALQAFQVTLTWNSVATTTAWQILALPQGSAAPNATSTGWIDVNASSPGFTQVDADSFSYVYTGLTAETAYSFYIRGNCGNIIGSPSTWTTPRNVTTPPSCYKPTALTATIIDPFDPTQSPFNVSLGWTNSVNSPVTEWQISIQAAGSPAPAVTQLGTTITQNPYLATGLTPNTCYDYYVRSVCGGVNGISTWAGPFNFCTPPTCPQPTTPGSTNPNEPTAFLNWTEVGTATQWEYIFQPPLGPVPGSATSGIIANGPASPDGVVTVNTGILTPGFYEFYVRSICSDSDKSFWTGPTTFFIALPPAVCASVDIDVTTTSPGVIDLCPGENCVDLAAEFTDSKDTSTYTVLPVVFAPPFPFTGGTQLPVTQDDVWSAPFTLPFNFCFYGVNYPSVNVGSNGVITFNVEEEGPGCPWAFNESLPDPNFPILNAVYGVYQDINPNVDTAPIVRSINYQILGEAPCRAFVVNYYNIAQFSCNLTAPLQTSQIVLYETSNIIEVYVQDRVSCTTWNGGSGVIGIQNVDGTIAHFPPDRNTGQWEAHNEAWRFTPDGNSNVEFSWLKDGEFYSDEPVINVCVSETTNMTAQAVYTGCGGQTSTKTEDVLLRVNEVIIPSMPNVVACQTYTLPALTIGNYFSQTGGIGPIDPNIPITTVGINTIYVYAETTTVPACEYEISFTVDIQNELVAPPLEPVASCDSYTLPGLDLPFNYYTGPGGTGTMYNGLGGDVVSTSQQLYVYGQSGECTAETTLDITIDTLQLLEQNSVSDCNEFNLGTVTLPANNAFYTAPGGPTGTGTVIPSDTVISETQTVYVYAQFGSCVEEGSFTVNIFGIDPPTVNITQPTCVTTTGTIEVLTPVSPGGVLPTNLFISEVTDSNLGSLTYVELFNGTTAPIDLSNYKLKIYNNGNADPSTNCDIALTGTIGVNETNVIKVSTNPNQGGVSPDQVYADCAGVNTNDNIRLTTSADVLVDIWGRTDDTDFTPNNEPGYTYRRNSNATVPSTVWNAADWTAIDPEDYSNVGLYAPFSSFVYQYNIDGGAWQFTTTFTNVAVGPHVINVQDITTGCTSFLNVLIEQQLANNPVTTIGYTSPVCNNSGNLLPDTSIVDFTTGGTYSSNPNTLVINANTGEIDVDSSPAGDYVITYTVAEDLTLCRNAGFSTFPVTITAVQVPDFAAVGPFCFETAVPSLTATSPNGIAGTWSPSAIDNTILGDSEYIFTPNEGLCAETITLTVRITALEIIPVFAPVDDFCAGTTAPELPASQNDIPGIWVPATIDNTTVGTSTYTFTPTPGRCATVQTLTATVLPSITSDFADIATICSGGAVPTLDTTSPNGVVGTWTPDVINPAVGQDYTFTPTLGQCATGQMLTVTIANNAQFQVIGGCLNGNYTLSITATDFDLESATYVWKYENNIISGQNDATIVVSQAGNYTCEVVYQGCTTEKPFNAISVSCTIQKGISPKGTNGGDGSNDYFDLEGQNVTKLEIFNRYGSKVYSKANYSKEWYGQTDGGDELPDGTYFYVIERNGEDSKTGWIYINHEL